MLLLVRSNMNVHFYIIMQSHEHNKSCFKIKLEYQAPLSSGKWTEDECYVLCYWLLMKMKYWKVCTSSGSL